jgi:hypothetical protein
MKRFTKGVVLKGETADVTENAEGSLFQNSSELRLKAYIEGAVRQVVTNNQSQVLTNKTIDADNNSVSNIQTSNLKAGVLNTSTTLASASDTQVPSALAVKTYVDDKAAAQNEASEISFAPAGTIAATTVQAMGQELDGDIQGHISDATDAHAASAISNTPSGNLVATTVQAALDELQSDVDTRATTTALTDHTTASANVHGLAGGSSVVGTTDSQTLTNKIITGADIRTPVRSDVKQDTKANLTTYATTASNGQLCFATDTKEMFQVVDNTLKTVGGGGVANIDALLTQTFDSAAVSDFTQTGLELVTVDMINGVQSARLIHQAASSRSFKQTISVDRKYRSELMQLSLQVRSSASNGNLTLLVTDETNSATIAASQPISTASQIIASLVTNATTTVSGFSNSAINGLSVGMTVTGSGIPTGTVVNAVNTTALTITLSQAATASATVSLNFSALPDRRVFSFTIPASCASLSYTITALQEANLPESYIDDVVIELASTALLSTSVEVPVIETQTSRISQAVSFGNADITGALTSSTGSGVYSYNSGTGVYTVTKNAQFDISATFRANGAASVQPLISDSSGSVEYATDTSLASAAARANASGSFYLTAGSTFKIRNALAGTTNEQYISVNAVHTSSTTKTIPLTQSGLVQEADSYYKAQGFSGALGSTNTGVLRLNDSTYLENIGSGFTVNSDSVNGTSITINKSGIYSLHYIINATTTQRVWYFTKNSTTLTAGALSTQSQIIAQTFTDSPADNDAWELSATPYLNIGDIIRVQCNGTTNITGTSNSFTIARQGSLSQVAINPNSRITIPSSELRMEGITGRGSTDTRVIQYSAISAIRGDAFTVASNSVNGTVITITKAGKISINANAQIAAGELFISENQAVLTSNPTASETLGYSFSPSSADAQNVSFVGTVNVGDILRITSSSAPSASSGNLLTILHEETSIGVSVSNTLPQFSQSDSSVRVDTANGYGSTGTRIRRFSNVRENIGVDVEYVDSATNGASFTAKSDGIYEVTYSENSVLDGFYAGISKNASSLTTVINALTDSEVLSIQRARNVSNSGSAVCAWSGYLVAGDVIRAHTDGSAANTNGQTKFTMSKVGKPNVTGVDVTPFVNIPLPNMTGWQPVTLTSTWTNLTLTGAARRNGDSMDLRVYGVLTGTPASGQLNIDMPVFNGAATVVDAAKIPGAASNYVYVSSGYLRDAGTQNYTPVMAVYNTATNFSFTYGTALNGTNPTSPFTFTSGDFFNISIQGIPVVGWDAVPNQLVSPTESFSTDTALLTYAGSATYTLSTLANAPVGTFITFTYATSTNTRTQTTTAPTQTTSSMNTNGFFVTPRAFNAASTAALPSVFCMQIGKGMKGVSTGLYKSTNKATAGSLDLIYNGGGTQYGALVSYDETSGILTVDSGLNSNAAGSAWNYYFNDATTQANGYVVINASKSPALTGVPLLQPRFATIQDVKSAGTAAGAATSGAWTTHTLNTLVDSTGIVSSLSSNQFVLQPGTYNIFGDAQFFRVNECKLRIRNITDSTTSLVGESGYADAGASGGGITIPVFGEITISATKTFELQWRVGTTKTINGLGSASNFGENEVYATVQIQKIK